MARAFRLMAGVHVGPGKDGPHTVYRVNEIVHSDRDLERDHGSEKFKEMRPRDYQRENDGWEPIRTSSPPETPRPFPVEGMTKEESSLPPENLSTMPSVEPPPQTLTNEELDGMTVAELKTLAAEEEIDLTGCNTKAQILAKLKGA